MVVTHDPLSLTAGNLKVPKFVPKLANFGDQMLSAFAAYRETIATGATRGRSTCIR